MANNLEILVNPANVSCICVKAGRGQSQLQETVRTAYTHTDSSHTGTYARIHTAPVFWRALHSQFQIFFFSLKYPRTYYLLVRSSPQDQMAP